MLDRFIFWLLIYRFWIDDLVNEFGNGLVRLLYERCRFFKLVNELNIFGMGFIRDVLVVWKDCREEELEREVGSFYVVRWLFLMLKVWRDVRLDRKGEEMLVKVLLLRKMLWREGMLVRGGMVLERWLFWRERDWREESFGSFCGRVLESDWDERLILVMLLELL